MKYSLKNLNLKPGNSGSNLVVSRQNREYHDLFRFIAWLVGTSPPVTTLVITLGILSGARKNPLSSCLPQLFRAWNFDMDNGTPYNGDGKNTTKYMRAVRAF